MQEGTGSLLALLLILLLALQQPCCCNELTNRNGTVLVASEIKQPVILQSMFNTDVTSVLFSTPSFTLVPAAWAYVSPTTPYVLARNFSILSDITPPTAIEWSFLESKLVVQRGLLVVFQNLVLLDIRKLDSMYFDWFINSPGAVVLINNSIIVDPVCNATDAAEDLKSVSKMPQVPLQRRNLVSAAPASCLQLPTGRECFDSGVLMQDLTLVLASTSAQSRDIAVTPAEAAAAATADHFIIRYHNTTRVCRRYLDKACLQQHSNDRTYCWEQQAAAVLPRAAVSSSGGGGVPAGVVAGAVVGGVLGLLGVVGAVVFLHRRRRTRTRSTDKHSTASLLNSTSAGQQSGQAANQGGSVLDDDRSWRGLQAQQTGTLHAGDGSARPSFGRDGIHLGMLLGAGSFGRVFKGRWHGRDVAIKIIHCLPSELERVLREAEIMLHLDHPNCVRALNCIVHRKPQPNGAAMGGATHAGSGEPQSGQQGGGDGSNSSSRKRSTANSVTQMLPVLRRSLQDGSPGGSGLSPTHGSQQAAAAVQPFVGSAGSSGRRSESPAAAADQQLFKPRGTQQQQQPQVSPVVVGSGGQVVAVQTTGSELRTTNETTPERNKQQLLEQQQQPPQHLEQLGSDLADDEDAPEQVAEVWLVLELCSGGNLQDSFKQKRDGFDMARLLCRLAEVAQGMSYLHSKHIMHGDLKSQNVLLFNSINGSFGQIAKLADFGLAGVLREGLTHHSTQHLGTISHCAPELLQDGRVSPAADVYAFGIMMWELLTSTTAFRDVHCGTIIQRVVVGGQRPPIPPDTPEDYAMLMEACWASNPADRPTFDQILQCLTIMLNSMDAVTTTTGNMLVSKDEDGADRTAAAVLGAAAAAGGAAGTGGPPPSLLQQTCAVRKPQAGGSAPAGISSSVGSFYMSRTLSNTISSSAGGSKLQVTASAGSENLAVQPAAAGGYLGGADPVLQSTRNDAAIARPAAASARTVGGATTTSSSSLKPKTGSQQQQPVPEQGALSRYAQQQVPALESAPAPAAHDSQGRIPTTGTLAGSAGGSDGRQQVMAGATTSGSGEAGPQAGTSAGSAGSGGSSKLSQLRGVMQSRHIQDLW